MPKVMVLSDEWFGFQWLRQSREDLAKLEALADDPNAQQALRDSQKQGRQNSNQESNQKTRQIQSRYAAMEVAVKGCDALQEEGPLTALCRFALEQLETGKPYGPYTAPEDTRSLEEWYQDQLKRAQQEVERNITMIRKKEEGLRQRNAWVAQLLEHFPLPGDEDLPEIFEYK
jgi:hypothetical protein